MVDRVTNGQMVFANTSRIMEHADLVLLAGINTRLAPTSVKVKDVVLKVKERVEAQRVKDEVLQLMRLKHKW